MGTMTLGRLELGPRRRMIIEGVFFFDPKADHKKVTGSVCGWGGCING